jgi:diguanylate cyclase (GGDEF)-like protein
MAGDNVAQSGTESGAIGTYIPEAEHRRSFISLRWLVIILAAYLTLFTHLSSPRFPVFFIFAVVFAATNITLAFVPSVWFESASAQAAITSCDVLFVCGTIYLLQVPNTYLNLEFILIFLLAAVWRDLRLVLFSLLMVSVLLGVFIYFRIAGFVWSVSIEQFLTLSLFFVVSIFYVFLSRQLRSDAVLSRMILEEKRNAEVIVEVMRRLSSSLKTEEVLSMVVNRLCELLNAGECSIITIDSKTGEAKVVVRSSEPDLRHAAVDRFSEPEMQEAFETRKIAIGTNPKRSVIAVPMISQDTVLGVIHISSERELGRPSDATIRFFEVMAGAAANALRNAQLFEEVEQRARTDFLTGLANHRYFQTTLASELARAQRHNHPLSLLIIDLDYLKIVNDRFGHPSGDLVIRTVAETIRLSCRDFDFAARYGGEEFVVLLPETPLAAAITVGERIRHKISVVEYAGIGNVTASIGVSNYPVNALTKEDLVRTADQALYAAKNAGRNRVASFDYPGGEARSAGTTPPRFARLPS